MPLVQHAAHGGDVGAPERPLLAPPAGAPVGVVGAQAAAFFMQRDGVVLSMVLRIFLRFIAQMLQANSPGAAHANKAGLHIVAVAFIHRFGSSLNEHVHFHVCVVDGVFEAVVGEASEQGTRTTATSVMFHPATGIACEVVAQAQEMLW